jgi:hypothetical protein
MCCSADSSGRRLSSCVLGEVAQRQALAFAALAGAGLEAAGEQLDERRFAGAVAAEQADALARAQGQLHARQDRLVAVAHGGVLDLQQRVGGGAAFAEAEAEGVSTWAAAMRSMRSSALMRLCAWRALVALARKRSDVFLQVGAMSRCCFSNIACCWDRRSAALALEVGIAAGVEGELLLLDVGDLGDQASRKSRSCEISSRVPR